MRPAALVKCLPHYLLSLKELLIMAETSGEISSERLKSFIKRIEKLEEDKAAVAEDLKEVYSEAKGAGFDTKIIRKIISMRKIELEKRREMDELLELYKSALGMDE
jgi:uncharacterized protein (UPF0335 family)